MPYSTELDADNSGFLEKEELASTATLWAEACKIETGIDVSADVDSMMASIDANGDGKLDLNEFVALFEVMCYKSNLWGA